MFLIYKCEHCGKKGLKPFGKRCEAVWRIKPYWFCNKACALAEKEKAIEAFNRSWRAVREAYRDEV